jgi:hypothetical protein
MSVSELLTAPRLTREGVRQANAAALAELASCAGWHVEFRFGDVFGTGCLARMTDDFAVLEPACFEGGGTTDSFPLPLGQEDPRRTTLAGVSYRLHFEDAGITMILRPPHRG